MSEEGRGNTSRRSFITKAASAALAATLPASAQSTAKKTPATASKSSAGAKSKRPLNVLFFMSDDMRPELASYHSRFNVHSPNIDALGAHGVRFDRNYCQFPLCNPSRSSLFTGHPPRETGILGNGEAVVKAHPEWTTLPPDYTAVGDPAWDALNLAPARHSAAAKK